MTHALTPRRQRGWWHSVRATADERTRPLPGDERIPDAIDTITHAVTIDGTPHEVWPWLVQMGAGTRAGWYSYDWLDNGRQPSADHVIAELQHPAVGTTFPAGPGVNEGFVLDALEPDRWLTLRFPDKNGRPNVTWTFVLEEIAAGRTRLIVRVRGGQGYRVFGLPPFLTKIVIRIIHFVMQRKQLLNLLERVERA